VVAAALRRERVVILRGEGLGIAVPGRGLEPRWLVRDLDLELGPGAITVVVGPNGSGKTSLLRTLLGLLQPRTGVVRLEGRALAELRPRERARTIAWLPQRTELPWAMPVERLVMLGRAPHLSALAGPSARDRRAVDEALTRVGADRLRDRDVTTLSGGELQRVLLARLLATEAPLLILDEPTTALDIGHALALLELCRELAASGHGILLSLHELELARRYGDRALLLCGDRGEWRAGECREVLAPDRLASVFGVEVALAGDQLRFAPRE
jgi:iron complex transport system ATP-binding protein